MQRVHTCHWGINQVWLAIVHQAWHRPAAGREAQHACRRRELARGGRVDGGAGAVHASQGGTDARQQARKCRQGLGWCADQAAGWGVSLLAGWLWAVTSQTHTHACLQPTACTPAAAKAHSMRCAATAAGLHAASWQAHVCTHVASATPHTTASRPSEWPHQSMNRRLAGPPGTLNSPCLPRNTSLAAAADGSMVTTTGTCGHDSQCGAL